MKTTTTTNKYLWNYEKITYTDGTSSNSTVRIIGTHGTTGAQGATGAKGDKGDKGATGATGAKGDDGQMLYATCSTAAGTAAKVAALLSGALTLTAGATVSVKFTNANTASSPTLNIASTGAKQIRLNGAALTSSAYYWIANAVVTFVYDGSYWNISDAGALRKASDAAKTATNYIKYDSTNGLVVGNLTGSTLGRNVCIDSDSVDIRNGTTVLASYSDNKIELGKNSKNSEIKLCGDVGTISADTYTYTDTEADDGSTVTVDNIYIKSDGITLGGGRKSIMNSNGPYSYALVDAQSLWNFSVADIQAYNDDNTKGAYVSAESTGKTTMFCRNSNNTSETEQSTNGLRIKINGTERYRLYNNETYLRGKSLLDWTYPVGAIYMSTSSTSPASLFGGTWAQITGRFLLAAGSGYTVNATGGNTTHVHASGSSKRLGTIGYKDSNGSAYGYSLGFEKCSDRTDLNITVGSPGAANANDHMPPYVVVYMWKRTA